MVTFKVYFRRSFFCCVFQLHTLRDTQFVEVELLFSSSRCSFSFSYAIVRYYLFLICFNYERKCEEMC